METSAEGHLMLDASDLLSARRQPAAVSGSLEQQTDILAKNRGTTLLI
jgi:hypothetical protein